MKLSIILILKVKGVVILDKLFENEVYKKLMENRIVFINGEINDTLASEVVAKLLYLDSLSNEDITIYINSPGGSVTSGLMIYDTIKYLNSEVSTIGIGLAASMASILLMAGTKGKRKILSHGKVMLHELSSATDGKISDVLVAANEMKKTHDTLSNIIAQNCHLSLEQVQSKLKEDFWLDSKQALEYGIIDKIVAKSSI